MIQTHKRFRKMLIYYDIDKQDKFQGQSLLSSNKTTFNSQMVKNAEK